MASTIAAVTTSGGGVVTTADASGNLNLLAGTTTVVALTTAGAAVTGTLSATGVATFAAGTVALPSITTSGDTNTGVYFPAADTVGITTGGAQRGAFSSTGLAVTGAISATGDISAASVSGTAVATQANQETATSTTTVVTPGRQQFHPSAAKGWVKCQMNGTSAGSYNVTSVTDTGIGYVTVTWDIDFSSTNYCAIGCAVFDPTGASAGVRWTQVFDSGYGVNTTTVWCGDGGYGGADPNYINVIAFGDQ